MVGITLEIRACFLTETEWTPQFFSVQELSEATSNLSRLVELNLLMMLTGKWQALAYRSPKAFSTLCKGGVVLIMVFSPRVLRLSLKVSTLSCCCAQHLISLG